MELNNISFVLVTGNGRVRNQKLVDFLMENKIQSYIPKGVMADELECFGTSHKHVANKKIYTCSQVAAALTHQICRIFAADLKTNYYIFLEDDAEIINENRFLEWLRSLNKDFINSNMLGIHLFPAQNGLLIKSKYSGLLRIIKLPDYAVGYILSSESLFFINSNATENLFGVADWPKAFSKLNWFAPKIPLVIHPAPNDSKYISYIQLQSDVLDSMKISNCLEFLSYVFFKATSIFPKYSSEPIQSEKLRSRVLWQ